MTPLVRKPLILTLLGLVAAVLCAVIVILLHLSHRYDGFAVSDANHYVLVYGPTALLTVLVSFWRQVDYDAKWFAPWEELQRGSAQARKSVLADYISTLQATALWRAVSHSHITVTATIAGFVLLKLTALASTGLLTIENTVRQSHASIAQSTAFSGTVFNASAFQTLFDQTMSYTTYGLLTNAISPALGIGNGVAYDTFTTPSSLSGTNVTFPVNVFQPNLECVPAHVQAQLTTNSSDEHPPIPIEITEPACTVVGRASLYGLNPANFSCPPRQLSGLVQSIECQPSVFAGQTGAYTLMTMLDMRYQQTIDTDAPAKEVAGEVTTTQWSMEIANLTAIACRLSYSMAQANVTATVANPIANVSLSALRLAATPKLSNFSDDDLYSMVLGALNAVPTMFGNVLDDAYAFEYPNSVTKMMARVANGSYASLLDPDVMSQAASTVYNALSAQVASSHLAQNVSIPQTALVIYNERRLQVSSLSSWLMFISMSLFLLSVAVLMWESFRKVQQKPHFETLIELAKVSYHSDQLRRPLINTQLVQESYLQQHLLSQKFSLSPVNDSRITVDTEISDPIAHTNQLSHKIPASKQWWVPLTLTRPVYVLMLVLPVLGILALELLQKLSDLHDGIVTLHSSNTVGETIGSRYLPALIALTTATLFNCLDFNALLLAPFHRLTAGEQISNLKRQKFIGQFPVLTIFRCAKNKLPGPVLSSLAAIVGSFQAIVVSGLYHPEEVPVADSWQLKRGDLFSSTWPNSVSTDNGAAVFSSLVENFNSTFPVGTFDELAFPSIYVQATNTSKGQAIGENVTISTDLPVLRAQIECDTLEPNSYNISLSSTSFQNSVTVEATYTLPAICPYGGSNGTANTTFVQQTFNFGVNISSSYIGKLLDIHMGPFNSIQSSSSGELAFPTPDNPAGCPSIALIYGLVNVNETSQDAQDTVVVQMCYQTLQTGVAQTTLSGPALQIDANSPPVANESSFQDVLVSNITADGTNYTSTALQYRIQRHFDEAFSIFNSTENPFSTNGGGSDPPVDQFFQGVLFGRSPIPLETLSLESADQRGTMMAGIQSFYRRYMAQAISLNMRTTDNTNETIGSGLNNVIAVGHAAQAFTVRRLVQDSTSKIVLQAMLGFMFLCGVGALSLTKMRNVLPAGCNPCTIWGQMSLWAGSQVAEQLANDGTDGPESQRLKSSHVSTTEIHDLSRVRVKLKWWYSGTGVRWYGIDDVSRDE